MKEYDLYIPLFFNDGSLIDPRVFTDLQDQLLDRFGGLTFHPQPHKGFWRMGGVTYRDQIIILRVITGKVTMARRFFAKLKRELKQRLEQEEILIVERDVRAL